jgi:hypothetical protein
MQKDLSNGKTSSDNYRKKMETVSSGRLVLDFHGKFNLTLISGGYPFDQDGPFLTGLQFYQPDVVRFKVTGF